MIKILASALLITSLVATSITSAFAIEGGTAYGNVPKTTETITMDGKMDAVYKEGLVVKSLAVDEKGNAATASFTAYLLWNGTDTIYCWADIVDSTPYDAPADAQAWDTDSLELFIDYSNKLSRTRDQYRVDIDGVGTYYETKTLTNEECLPYGFIGYAAEKTSTGYSVEFAMKAYKETIAAGQNLGFHLMLNDMISAGNRVNIHSDACNNTPNKFGYITLSDTTVKAPAATTTTTTTPTAPATFDISVVLAAVAAVAGAGVVVSKKKH